MTEQKQTVVPAPTETPRTHQSVVAAVIDRGGSFLICRRPETKNHGGLWEFPGGKVDQNESITSAVARELAEELAVETVAVGEVLFSSRDSHSGYEIHFIPTQISGEPIALEHSAIAWCERANLLAYPLAPSDRAFATFLLENKENAAHPRQGLS